MKEVIPSITLRPTIKICGREALTKNEPVIEEMPLTVYYNGKELLTMLYTPGEEQELVTGFLMSEGLVSNTSQIKAFEFDAKSGIAKVFTNDGKIVDEQQFLKRYLTACCGKGRISVYFAADEALLQPIVSKVIITTGQVIDYMQMLEVASETFKLTGGVHNGALADKDQLVICAQDIGRHNVFDKIYGQCLIKGIETQDKIMVFSGRISAEIVLKIGKMRIPIIIARSAPTSLALDLAGELGITIIGFVRENRMNIYTHAGRVIIDK